MRDHDRKTLVWGLFLMLLGGFWMLHSVGVVRGFWNALVGGTLTLSGGVFLALLAWSNLERRAGLLVPAGLLTASSLVIFGRGVRVLPEALIPLVLLSGLALPFAALYRLDTRRTWSLWLAWLFGAIAVVATLDELGRWGERLSGPFFLCLLSVPFLWHFARRGREWSLGVGGGFASLGLSTTLDALWLPDRLQMAAFFLGLAATFAAVYVLGRPGKVAWARWAAFSAAAIGLIGLLAGPVLKFGIPVFLIGLGAWLIFADRGRNGSLGPAQPAAGAPGGAGAPQA